MQLDSEKQMYNVCRHVLRKYNPFRDEAIAKYTLCSSTLNVMESWDQQGIFVYYRERRTDNIFLQSLE